MKQSNPLFYRTAKHYQIPAARKETARKLLAEQQRLLYRGTPNKIFQTLLTMARRPTNSFSHTLTAWNHAARVPYQICSSLPRMFADIGIAVPLYKDKVRTIGFMLNAEGLRVLELIALRDEDHRAFVEAYYPKDGLAVLNKWQLISDFNSSALNPANQPRKETFLPF